jgi:hypothetical protein
MSSIFDEFYNSDSEDEAPPNQTHFFSEARRLSLANGFEIAQTRPTLRNIAVLSSQFPWLWENTSWIIYESVGPWRLLIRWRFRVHNIYNYELALGSTIDKDMAVDSDAVYCGHHHRREKAIFFTVKSSLLFADTIKKTRGAVGCLKNNGCITGLNCPDDSSHPSFVPLYLYEI